MIDYLSVIDEQSQRFAAAVRHGDLAAQVPSCPDWSLADLAWHLTEVQHFWGSIAEGLLDDPDDVVAIDRPADGDMADLFEDRSARMGSWLAQRDPSDACWSWNDAGRSIGWVRRRQAHEALIHRIDAEQAVGRISTIDAELATDGVSEMLESQIDGPVPEWGRVDLDDQRGLLVATDTGATWGLHFGRFRGTSPASGTAYDLDTLTIVDPPEDPDVTLAGRAVDLDLYLWGRMDQSVLALSGDPSLAGRVREIAAEATQ